MPRRQPITLRLRTAARWPGGIALTAWNYMWRTTAVHRWEMTGSADEDGAPALPAGVDPKGLQETGDGVGPLLHRIYRTRILGGTLGPEELIERIVADLDVIAPSEFATFQRLDGEDGPASPGDDYIVRMPGPWDGPVRVLDVRRDGFRLATLPGHLEAGQIEFRARSDRHAVEFTIESWARSGDRLSDLMYTHLRLAKEVQLHMWTSALERVVKLTGGTMQGGIVITTRRVDAGRLDDGGTGRATGRAARQLTKLSRTDVNFDVACIAEATAANGWHVDELLQVLPGERPGPPEPGGTWELARRLIVDYQLADPDVVRAVYDEDSPFDGRDMLLQIRFLWLRFAAGVRISEVYEEEREVDGARARVAGWAYRTLHGHFEQGEMHYQVWKWLDTGAVEFRLHAVSKVAGTGPWVLRTGFRVFGRTNQLRFYQQICRRVLRLTEAELETLRVAAAAESHRRARALSPAASRGRVA